MSFVGLQKSSFYYAYNEKIYLNKLDNKLIVRYNQNKKSDKKLISLYSELMDKSIDWKDDSTCIITISASEKVILKNKILNQSDVKSCNDVYTINTGLEMGVTDEFVVGFNKNVTQKEIENIHKEYGVEVVKTTDYYQLLKVPTGIDALKIANIYQESGLAYFSHPNFISDQVLHQVIPTDPYFVNQFYLNNTGQVFTDGHSGVVDAEIDAPEAWDIILGNGNIIIAVIDEVITSDHPDLPNTRQVRLNGSNFADGNANNPSPSGDHAHGNSCAGIIAATQNNEGIAGIVPLCKIMPIRKFNADDSGITPEKNAAAIDFARTHGAAIISNSWGYNSDNPNLYPIIKEAIINATTTGRNNLGCVVIYSASNSANHNISQDGYISFPGNVDVAGVLTVGASDRNDLLAIYSPTSQPTSPNNQIIDIVAPSNRAYSSQIANETSEVWTIDTPGNTGYNSVKSTDGGTLPVVGSILPNSGTNYLSYTGRFGGTSAACPQVAAVAALVLSINPNLTQQQVFNIITSSADHGTHYTYTNGRSNEFGYGRLNAHAAVIQALSTLTISGPSTACPGTSYKINNLPTSCNVTWSGSSPWRYTLTQAGDSCLFTYIQQACTIQLTGTIINNSDTISLTKQIYLSHAPDYYAIYAQLTTGGNTDWLQDYNCLVDYYFPGNYYGQIDILDPESQPHIDQVTWTKIWQSQGTSIAAIGGSADGKHVTAHLKPLGSTATFRMTATNTCGSFSYDYTFSATGVPCMQMESMVTTPQVNIYPNPNNGEFTVGYNSQDQNTGIQEIIVTTNMGSTILHRKYKNEKQITINLSSIKSGNYFLEVFDGKDWTCNQVSIKN